VTIYQSQAPISSVRAELLSLLKKVVLSLLILSMPPRPRRTPINISSAFLSMVFPLQFFYSSPQPVKDILWQHSPRSTTFNHRFLLWAFLVLLVFQPCEEVPHPARPFRGRAGISTLSPPFFQVLPDTFPCLAFISLCQPTTMSSRDCSSRFFFVD